MRIGEEIFGLLVEDGTSKSTPYVSIGFSEWGFQGSHLASEPATELSGVLEVHHTPLYSSEIKPSLLRWRLLLLSMSPP